MKTKKLFEIIQKEIVGEALVEKAQLVDHNANGVQVWGNETVNKVALGVSCNSVFLQKAAHWGAQVCLFHHGLALNDKNIYNSRFDIPTQKQLKHIFEHNFTVAGYHYVLDAHPEIGNNAQIIAQLGAKRLDIPYFAGWGWVAEFAEPKFVQDIAKDCARIFKHDVFMILGGPEKVKRLGVCSGGAKPTGETLFELMDKEIDLHLAGEIAEAGPALARESGFNYLACGHYATEIFGIKALGAKIKERFPDLEVDFIDVWNEL